MTEKNVPLADIQALIPEVRKMAVKKFYRMPKRLRTLHTQNDWVQDAMVIFLNLVSNYSPEKGAFENYVRFTLPKRLISVQRDIFKDNPLVNEELWKLSKSLERELGRKPSAEEFAEHAGYSIEKAQEFLDSGFGERIFGGEDEVQAEVKTGISPEDQYIRLEARKILWECIDHLEPGLKVLFVRHEFDGISFQKLFDKPECRKILESRSISTFQRDYKKTAFDSVENCVRNKYEIKS